jgi:drug/metabolite transporter (DMT)-like permease
MNMLLPTAAAMVNGILVGSAIVATRFVIDQSSPVSLALLRYCIGFCCLLPPILWTRQLRFERRDLLSIGLLGTLQFGVVIFLLNCCAAIHFLGPRGAHFFVVPAADDGLFGRPRP